MPRLNFCGRKIFQILVVSNNINRISGTFCYVSVTMSTWSPSPNIIIIITPILRCYSCLSSSSSPSDYSDISLSQSPSYSRGYTTPSSYYSEFILLWAHHHWHILCQWYSVIVGRYHLGLFTQHLDLRLVFQGMGMHGMIFYFYHMFIPCLRIYL